MANIRISRRQALISTAAFAGALALPGLSRAASRPLITHGVQSGDMTHDSAMIWARADRESRMLVEWSTTESFADAHQVQRLDIGQTTDMSGKILLDGLPSDQDIFYRVVMQDLADLNASSEPVVGRFRTAPLEARDVSFVWSGDTAGQGWGIDTDRGGMAIYGTMLKHRPDFFIHSGDTVYADGALQDEVTLADGTKWRNVLTDAKRKVAETLDEYRGQHLYNMLDANVRAFNAEVPMLVQWDDHEVRNNWYPNQILDDDRYSVKNVSLLAARAAQAFHEVYPTRRFPEEPNRVYRKVAYGPLLDVFFLDMRTYRADNAANNETEEGPTTVFLGADQRAWLKRELKASKATWKVIAADMPLGLIVWNDFKNLSGSEALAQGDGPALGRELEIADLLSFLKHEAIQNTVWLTADVHYTAAHHYSPDRAQFQDFEPFWEFVSGPLHAGTFGPNDLDNTFGPEIKYIKAPSAEQGQNLSPAEGMQFFGKVDIAAATGVMTVRLMDTADTELWSVELEPSKA